MVYADSFHETSDGQWLRELRRRFNLRQSDIAEIFHIHSGRVCEWERGQKPIPPEYKAELVERYENMREV